MTEPNWHYLSATGLNGARPVRAGRRHGECGAGVTVGLASTEPAQYGRDDAWDDARTTRDDEIASTEPAQYGRDDSQCRFAAVAGVPASTEPAQYGRDDRHQRTRLVPRRPRLNGARPVRAGRLRPNETVHHKNGIRLNGARPVRAGRRGNFAAHPLPHLWPQRSPPSTGGTTQHPSCATRSATHRLNGARPVRAGRRGSAAGR